MLPRRSPSDARIARVEAALARSAWRRMTVEAVAVRLVAELDGDLPARDDSRVWMVQRTLSACRWRSLSAGGLTRQAVLALESWRASQRQLERELAWLLHSDD